MDKETKYVRWQTFVWVVAILTLTMGYIITAQTKISDQLNTNNVKFAEITTKLTSIESGILEMRIDLKNHLLQK
jgi:hypothetical protein